MASLQNRHVMKESSRKICIAAAILLLAAGGAACGKAEAKEPLKITFMHGWGGSPATHKTMQMIYDKYQKENPQVILNSIPSSDSSIAVKNANDMLAVGKMPDIVSTNGLAYYVDNVQKQDSALDLMPYIEKDKEFKDEIHPLVLKVWTNDDNTLYTIPDAMEAVGYWYNEKYLKEAGEVDEKGQVILPGDWGEFLSLCERMQLWCEGTGSISVMRLEDVQLAENLFFARLAGEDETGLAMVDTLPDFFDVPQMKKTVEDIGKLLRYSKDTDTIDNARQDFVEGQSVFYFNGIWESEMILGANAKENIRYACYPTNYGKKLSYVSPSSGYIIKKHENEAENLACIGFLKYILNKNMQESMAIKTGQAPENPNVNYQKLEAENPLLGKSLKTIMAADVQIKTISSAWGTPKTEALKKTIRSAAEDEEHYQVFLGQLNSK